MANQCPKCGGKLSPLYLKQDCPYCGVNLVYYNAEERLEADAIKAEAEWAALGRWLTRLKSATIAGPFPIIRLVWSFVPLILLAFLPLFHTQLTFPFVDGSVRSINGIQAVMGIFSINFDALNALGGVEAFHTIPAHVYIYIVCLLLTAVFCALLFLSVAFSYTRYGERRNIVLSLFAIATLWTAVDAYNTIYSSSLWIGLRISSCEFGIGFYLTLAALVLYIILNIIIWARRRHFKLEG